MVAVGILLLVYKPNLDVEVLRSAVTFINVQQIYEDRRYSNRVKDSE
jgi:hypothetical protein